MHGLENPNNFTNLTKSTFYQENTKIGLNHTSKINLNEDRKFNVSLTNNISNMDLNYLEQ